MGKNCDISPPPPFRRPIIKYYLRQLVTMTMFVGKSYTFHDFFLDGCRAANGTSSIFQQQFITASWIYLATISYPLICIHCPSNFEENCVREGNWSERVDEAYGTSKLDALDLLVYQRHWKLLHLNSDHRNFGQHRVQVGDWSSFGIF